MYVFHTFLDSGLYSKQFSLFPTNITRCLVCCCALLVSVMSRSLYSFPMIRSSRAVWLQSMAYHWKSYTGLSDALDWATDPSGGVSWFCSRVASFKFRATTWQSPASIGKSLRQGICRNPALRQTQVPNFLRPCPTFQDWL